MDVERNSFGDFDDAFSDKVIRNGFLKKVYGILTVQIAITAGIIALFVFVDGINVWVAENPWFFWANFGVVMAMIIVLVCTNDVRRRFPINIICLLIFTVFEALTLGGISTFYSGSEVFIAMAITALVVFVLSLIAFQTTYDFTTKLGFIGVLLAVLIGVGFTAIFYHPDWVIYLYLGLGVLVFGFYLVVDTQIMLTGKHRFTVSPEEYIFAALNLYLDIINLFLFILRIVGVAND